MRTFVERKKTAFLHAHAVQLLLWTWYPADYNEQHIESIFPAMLSMPYGDGEQAEKRELDLEICSMDDVEEQTDEKISMAVWFFMDDNTVSDLLEDQEEITLSVTEEAKENLIRILEGCRSQTKKRCYMGHMSLEDLEKLRREVRQKA